MVGMRGTSPHESHPMSLTSFLTDTQILLAATAVAFIAGVVLSQRVKDKLRGVPSELRSAIASTESQTLTAMKAAQADALSKLLPAAAAVKPVAEPVKAAAVAPAPVVAPAPAPAPAPVAAAPAPAPAPEPAEGEKVALPAA